MNRRHFCKTLLFTPLLSPLFEASGLGSHALEIQLISSLPQNTIFTLLNEIKKKNAVPFRNYVFLNDHPKKRELIPALSRNHMRHAFSCRDADLSFSFIRLSKPVSPSFTLIKKGKIMDIRTGRLFSLWQEMNQKEQASSLLTLVSFHKKKVLIQKGMMASVYLEGNKVDSLSLKESNIKSYRTLRGSIDVLIENEKVKVVHSSCQNKICLHTPPLTFEGERVICAPNHFLLEIDPRSSVDTIIG